MDRDELVERVAEERHTRRNTYMDETKEVIHLWAHVVSQPFHAKYVETLRADARAALAIIEPAVREDIARELDCGCECRDAVLAATTKTDRWRACGRDPCSALDARDIRTGAKP
jgi:hypothetical protein